MSKKKKYSFNKIEQIVNSITHKMQQDKYKPNKIVTLARGGFIPARLMARNLFVKKMYSIGLTLYNQDDKKTFPTIYQPLIGDFNPNDKILIIDDIVDSGESIVIPRNMLQVKGITNIKTCSVFYKQCSAYTPDYYGKIVPDDEWVVFPWE